MKGKNKVKGGKKIEGKESEIEKGRKKEERDKENQRWGEERN